MEEFQAMAVAALVVGLMARLRARGILREADVSEIFDLALLGLEEMGLPEGSAEWKAHNFLTDLRAASDPPASRSGEPA
ncbi:MAG: hypothetical protein ACYC8V_09515 [Caulobacteraceae bacterium]